jgi:uncharacterized membrane protein
MLPFARYTIAFCASAFIAGCADSPGDISRDAEPFAGIAADETITALGTEPFWKLEISPEGGRYQAVYATPENIDGSAFTATRFAGNNGLGYSGELDGRAVNLALTPGECSDGMSDRVYPFTATLAVGEETLFGCAYTDAAPFTGDPAP